MEFIKLSIESARNMWYSQIKNNLNKGFDFHKYQKIDLKEKDNTTITLTLGGDGIYS